MGSPDTALLALAESVADGSAIDWVAAESLIRQPDHSVVRQLRVVAELAALHRTLPLDAHRLPSGPSRRAASAPAIGRWAHLDLIERLGGGTFGEVYRAWDRHLEREVALKLLRVGDEHGEDLGTARIVAEGRLLARLHHPNVVTVYGVAVHDGRVGLWMELIDGVTLERTVTAGGPMSAREAAIVGIDLCRALAALHGAGLIHRDIKTQNVVREDGGRTVLMDLGAGRVIDPNTPRTEADLAGTPLYLAPELFEGAAASERTDLYSLGVLLYRLVTGAFPVRATTIDELHDAHRHRRATRLRDVRADLPSAFVRVVDRAIAANPAERYASAGELEADLDASFNAGATKPVAVGRRWAARWIAAASAALILTALALTVGSRWLFRASPAIAPGAIRSIAVLPLVNLSGDPSQEYFADGMTDELIDTLGRLGGVNVISRTSVMRFKGSARPLPDIARTLGVDAVLEGSVLALPPGPLNGSTAKRVRINARLIYAGSDTQLWDKTFESVVSDVLSLQSTVAKSVTAALNAHRASPRLIDEPSTGQSGQAVSPEAFDEYLRGRYLWNKRTPTDLQKALEAFQQAIALDRNSAEAWNGLADALILLANQGETAPTDAMPRAKVAARRALDLNRESAEAHASLATIAFAYDWDPATAEAEFAESLSLNPSYATARNWHGLSLAYSGRPFEAIEELKRAQTLDPLALVTPVNIARCYYFARNYDRALDLLRNIADQEPTSWMVHAALGQTYIATGDYGAAIGELRRARELSPLTIRNLAVLGDAYGRAGQLGEASNVARELAQISRSRYVPPAYQALVAIGVHSNDRALEYLAQARAERSEWITQLNIEPEFDPLRSDPRFTRMFTSVRNGANPR